MAQTTDYDRLGAFEAAAAISAGQACIVDSYSTAKNRTLVEPGNGNAYIGVAVNDAKVGEMVRIASCTGERVRVRAAGAIARYDRLNIDSDGKFQTTSGNTHNAIALSAVADATADGIVDAILVRGRQFSRSPVPPTIADQSLVAGGTATLAGLTAFTGGEGDLSYTLRNLPNGLIFNGNTRGIRSTSSSVAGGPVTVEYIATDELGQTGSTTFQLTLT